MGDKSAIEWTDATWNPIRGCSRVSEGCRRCYAEIVAARFSGPGQPYEGLARRKRVVEDGTGNSGTVARWTGEVRFVEEALTLPLRWTKPRRIFVNSMSDLFHERLTDEQIFRVVDVMIRARIKNGHTFQVLTKRPARMLDFARKGYIGPAGLQGVHLGVSVENQAAYDARYPLLAQTPADVRWISFEPSLGGIDFRLKRVGRTPVIVRCPTCEGSMSVPVPGGGAACPRCFDSHEGQGIFTGPDWLVIGGESGPGARPAHPDWFRAARDQCVAAGVPFFFKQWGEWAPFVVNGPVPMDDGRQYRRVTRAGPAFPWTDDWQDGDECMGRVGKKAAGRNLDGREWNEFPR